MSAPDYTADAHSGRTQRAHTAGAHKDHTKRSRTGLAGQASRAGSRGRISPIHKAANSRGSTEGPKEKPHESNTGGSGVDRVISRQSKKRFPE